MSIIQNIPRWLGITAPKWVHQKIARRNMPIMAVLAASAILYAGMLLFFLFTRTPSSLEGFDAAAYKSEQTAMVFLVAVVSTIIVMAACIVFAIVYIRKNLVRPGIATAVTFVFAYVLVMLWVVACSGQDPQRQIMFFASMQFLVVSVEFGSAEFEQRVKKVADQIAEIDVDGQSYKLTYSGGYMRGVVSNNDDFRVMLHHADENLIEAKRRGKNQLVGERIEK